MFSYLGSKSKLVKLYPKPEYGHIIEPFAGSARYALEHWDRNVTLYDLSETVIGVWRYLLQASREDVLSLPEPPSKVHIEDFAPSLSQPEKDLIGFHLCRGKAKPRKVGHGQNGWTRDKVRIAANLYKIRHWKLVCGSYRDAPDVLATWFIDPPYKATMERLGNSDRYPYWKVSYGALARWARKRRGQVIVCEGEQADWLPFELLKTVNANSNNRTAKKNGEYIWTY